MNIIELNKQQQTVSANAMSTNQYGIYLGRNGKVAGAIVRKDGKSGFKQMDVDNVSAALMSGVAKYVAKLSGEGQGRIDVITITSVAIAYRTIRGFWRNGLSAEEAYAAMSSTAFYADNTGEMAEAKAQSREALKLFVHSCYSAIEAGCLLSIIPSGDFGKLFISNSGNQELTEGQKVNFANGSSDEGLSIFGWKSFSRQNATIHIDAEGRAFLRKSNAFFDLLVENAIAKLWKVLPAAKPEFSIEKATEVDLF